jgi:hypothetical protein
MSQETEEGITPGPNATDQGSDRNPDAIIADLEEKIASRTEKILVPLTAQGEVMAIMPRSIEEAQRYANGLCLSGIVPDAFREGGKRDGLPNAPLVMMGILKAMELGVPPQTGLAGLLPLNGRFAVWGDLAAALVHRTGQVAKQQTVEVGALNFDPGAQIGDWPDAYGIRFMIWRVDQDDPYVGEFTVRDAKRAGLWNHPRKEPWIKYPRRMLYNRARAFALRDGFADGLHGLTIADEIVDLLPMPVTERGGSERTKLLIDDRPEETGATDEAEAGD